MRIKWIYLSLLFLLTTSIPALSPADEPSDKVYVIPVDGEISKGLVYLIRRGIDEAEANNAKALILRMNTNGGRLDATEDIMEELGHTSVEAITFVDRKAFSAGAFIAVATNRIYMAPGSVIGAATPVMLGPGGPKEIGKSFEEKVTSATRALIRSAAEKNGHPVKVVEAMVDRDVEIPGIIAKGKLLTLTDEEAAEKGIGLSEGTVSSIEEILQKEDMAGATVVKLKPLWSESAALFLTNSVVSGLLMMIGLLGLYIEFKTPGFGLPGIIGITALLLFFWGHRVAGLAGFEELAILFLGFFLLAVEIFVIPGFGVVGITGLIAIFLAILMSMVRHLPGTPIIPDFQKLSQPLVSMAIGILGSFFGGIFIFRFMPKTSAAHRIILTTDEKRSAGYGATSKPLEQLIGREGKAITILRPAGKAKFGEDIINVVTEGDFLENGCPVRVLTVEGGRVVVTAVRDEDAST
jgi:membrane-bound serine protease (ClpP class)